MAKKVDKKQLSDFAPAYRKTIERIMKQNPEASVERAREIIYENRTAKALAKNPDVSLAEARGHKPKPLPANATKTEKELRALTEKAGNLTLKAKFDMIDQDRAKEAKQIIKAMKKEVSIMEGKVEQEVDIKPIEWTLWSQEQKEREVKYKELLAQMGDSGQPKAQGILDNIIKVGRSMVGMNQDTKKYAAAVTRLEKLNKDFAKTGFSIVENIAIRTEGMSPESQKALKIIEKMKRETEKMWALKSRRPGTEGYYTSQSTLRGLYKQLEQLGLVNRSGDIVAGDVGYH